MTTPMRDESARILIGGKLIPRCMPMIDHELCHPVGWHPQLYDKKVAEYDRLITVIERCSVKNARNAGKLWDVHAELVVSRIGKKLLTKPEWVVPELRATLHGCRVLLDQWRYLEETANSGRFRFAFDLEDHILTLSLLGIPLNQRMRRHKYEPPVHMENQDDRRQHVIAFIQARIAELEGLILDHEFNDQENREMAQLYPDLFPDKTMIRLKRDLNKVEQDLASMWLNAEAILNPNKVETPEEATDEQATASRKATQEAKSQAAKTRSPRTSSKDFPPVESQTTEGDTTESCSHESNDTHCRC